MSRRSAPPVLALIASASLAACATLHAMPRPEFAQRASPPPGQYEIELLAGLSGGLAVVDGCLGVSSRFGNDGSFSTLVWPGNASLESSPEGWRVRNRDTGETIGIGETIVGGGGFSGPFDAQLLREYNRMLTSDLSEKCAAKGVFSLNKDFRPG